MVLYDIWFSCLRSQNANAKTKAEKCSFATGKKRDCVTRVIDDTLVV